MIILFDVYFAIYTAFLRLSSIFLWGNFWFNLSEFDIHLKSLKVWNKWLVCYLIGSKAYITTYETNNLIVVEYGFRYGKGLYLIWIGYDRHLSSQTCQINDNDGLLEFSNFQLVI